MKRLLVPGIPFTVSMALSLSTAGSHLYWQDSGFFLVAVKELGVLYPPGYSLYLLVCKAWTLLTGFLDFTYAVHLFSCLCAAGAAGAIAVAARDLLGTAGPIFRTTQEPGPGADRVGILIGCLAASGFTFWSAAILAKGYAFYFLILSLLLWRMIRADASGDPRDLTIVAALVGLGWQAHPSLSTAGLALALFAAAQYRKLGARGLALRAGLAAACAIGPAVVLPVLAAREPALMFARPDSLGSWAEYLVGARFARLPGSFGLDGSRVLSVPRYFWEEFLAVGALGVVLGAVRLARIHPRLLLGVAAWVLPLLAVTVLFRWEGQHDFWMMGAWIPLWLLAAVGLSGIGRPGPAAVGLAVAGMVWAVAANRPDLDQRRYGLAEAMGHLELDALDPHSVLVLTSDDALASTTYLQRVRGVRPDVALVQAPLLGVDPDWYDRLLERRHPFLKPPDYAGLRGRFPQASPWATALGAFAGANASRDHPVFFELGPPAEMLPPDFALVPAGQLLKLVPRGERRVEEKYWSAPVAAESLPGLFRRPRGQFLERSPGSIRVRPEPYEKRLLRELLRARKNLADWAAMSGTPEGFRRSAELYETIVTLDPWTGEDPGAAVPLARAYFGMRRFDRAEPWLLKAVRMPLPSVVRAQLCCLLVEIYRAWNRPADAQAWSAAALAIPELPAELRERLNAR